MADREVRRRSGQIRHGRKAGLLALPITEFQPLRHFRVLDKTMSLDNKSMVGGDPSYMSYSSNLLPEIHESKIKQC